MTATRSTFVLGSVGIKGAFPAMHRQSQRRKVTLKCRVVFIPCPADKAASLMACVNGSLLALRILFMLFKMHR